MPSVPTSCGAGGYIILCLCALAAHTQSLIHNLEGNRRSATPGKFQRCCARSFATSSCTVTMTERVTAGVLLPRVHLQTQSHSRSSLLYALLSIRII